MVKRHIEFEHINARVTKDADERAVRIDAHQFPDGVFADTPQEVRSQCIIKTLFRAESITDTRFRNEDLRYRRIILDFLPQLLRIHPQIVELVLVLRPPYLP